MTYSKDLRKRVIQYQTEGKTVEETTTNLRIGLSTVVRIRRHFAQYGAYSNPFAAEAGRRSNWDEPIVKVRPIYLSYILFSTCEKPCSKSKLIGILQS